MAWATVEDKKPVPEGRLGFGSLCPDSIQRFHTTRWLTVALCLQKLCVVYGSFGIGAVMITTIEKRFALTYQATTLFTTIPIIAVFITVLPLSHYANIGHKGRWIANCGMAIALAECLIVASEFVTPSYQVFETGKLNTSFVCGANSGSSEESVYQDDSRTGLTIGFAMVVFGKCCIAVAAAIIGRMSQLYIDENVSQKSSAMYMGILAFTGAIGIVIGFGLGSIWTKVHTDFIFVKASQLDLSGPDDPRWVGAWWLGYASAAIVTFITSIPIYAFAPILPNTARIRAKDVATVHSTYRAVNTKQFTNIPAQIKSILKVPYVALKLIQNFLTVLLFSGFISLIPKLIENYYNLSLAEAGLYFGAVTMPVGLASFIFGGWLHRRLKLNIKQDFQMDLVLTILKVCFVWTWFLYCDGPAWAGVNVPYADDKALVPLVNGSLLHSCNTECDCNDYFKPVCDPDSKIVFYSPCYAGCLDYSMVDDPKHKNQWSQCSCLPTPVNITAEPVHLVEGLCTTWCFGKLAIIVAAGVPMTILQTLSFAPNTQLGLRLVPKDMRMLQDGFFKSILAIAAIPGQFLFGYMVDANCIMWHQDLSKNQCLRYNVENMPYLAISLMVAQMVLSVVINLLNQCMYKPPVQPMSSEMKPTSTTTSSIYPSLPGATDHNHNHHATVTEKPAVGST